MHLLPLPRGFRSALAFFTIASNSLVTAAPPPTTGDTPSEKCYIAAFRAPAHVTRSSPEVFHQMVDAVLDLLKSKHALLAADPSRPMIQTQENIPQETLLNLAKDAGANYLLVLTIDRPAASWLKVSIAAFDLSGKPLWEEHASYGGGVSGKKAPDKVLEKLRKQLEPRFGKPGLPLAKEAPSAAR